MYKDEQTNIIRAQQQLRSTTLDNDEREPDERKLRIMLAAFSRLSLRGFVPSLTTNVHRRVLNSTPATRAFSVSQPTFDPAAKTRAAAKAAPKTKAKPAKKATAVKKKPAKKTTKTAAAKKPVKKPAKKVAKKPVKPGALRLCFI